MSAEYVALQESLERLREHRAALTEALAGLTQLMRDLDADIKITELRLQALGYAGDGSDLP